jgi:deoxyribose-phosphate aldolase
MASDQPPLIPYDAALASYIDHTLLSPDADGQAVRALCAEAIRFGFAAVCVRSGHVALAADLLAEGMVKVACVANFPTGDQTLSEVLAEVASALSDGAREVDYVMDLPAALSGDWARVGAAMAAVVREAHASGAAVKVIIEACALDDSMKVKACEAAMAAGADFVKTSTGYGSHGATVADVALMRRSVGACMGVKASGGIQDRLQAWSMIDAGASRLGTSQSLKVIGATLVSPLTAR